MPHTPYFLTELGIMLATMHQRRENGECPFCGKDMTNATFKDAASKKEFEISGICQECQDDYFTHMEEL